MFTKEELSNFLYDSQGFAEYFSSKYYENYDLYSCVGVGEDGRVGDGFEECTGTA